MVQSFGVTPIRGHSPLAVMSDDLALNWPSMDQKPQIRLVVAGWERTLMKS